MAKNTSVNAAAKYARDVVSGRIVACKYVIQACQRHLDDLARCKAKGYPYRFNKDKAERACKFIQLLPHTKGSGHESHCPSVGSSLNPGNCSSMR